MQVQNERFQKFVGAVAPVLTRPLKRSQYSKYLYSLTLNFKNHNEIPTKINHYKFLSKFSQVFYLDSCYLSKTLWDSNIFGHAYHLYFQINVSGKKIVKGRITCFLKHQGTIIGFVEEYLSLNSYWNDYGKLSGICTNAFKIKRCDRDLWSKLLIFKRAFHRLRVLPHLCPPHSFWPLLRAFKWGTV